MSSQRAQRSCQSCIRRKVRCDKRDPCSACGKAGQTCVFPPRVPRVRRTKKTLNAEMASRISELEKKLQKKFDEEDDVSAKPQQKQSKSPDVDDDYYLAPEQSQDERHLAPEPKNRTDILVQQGSTSRYFSDIVLSKVINEEQHDVRTALATPSSTPSSSANGPSPFNPLGILSAPDTVRLPHTYHPAKDIAASLWHQYLEVVEECTFKVLHVPTDEITVFSTIENPSAATAGDLALCFAVYFAACASMESREAFRVLGQDDTQAMLKLKHGFEQALAHSDFLDAPSETTIKALIIYMGALRIRHRGKGTWILNGIAIRAARSLGLNVDGRRLGLPPFRAEMRRRIWWCLMAFDSRANEDYGLPGTGENLRLRSVDLPLNVGDNDLHLDMIELPPSRTDWTTMAPTLILLETFSAVGELATGSLSSSPLENDRRQIMERARKSVSRYTQHANLVIPRQRRVILVSRLVLKKIDFISRLQWQLRRNESSRDQFITDANMVEALEISELTRALQTDDLLKKYAVCSKAYPQYNVVLYILYHLCVRPLDSHSNKAWELIKGGVAPWRGSEVEGIGPKAEVLETLLVKAKTVRELALAGRSASYQNEGPSSLTKANTMALPGVQEYAPLDVSGTLSWPMAVDGVNFDGEFMQQLDWTTFFSGCPSI